MKLLYITDVFSGLKDYVSGRGGARGMPGFYRPLQGLESAGHEIHVIFNTVDNVIPRISKNIFFYNVGSWRFHSNRFIAHILLAVFRGLKLHKQIGFDMVYGQQVYGATVAFLLSRIIGIPNATRLYGSGLYGRYGTNKRRILCKRQSLKAALPFLLPTEHLVITQDGTQADQIAKLFGVQEQKIHVWFNGFDVDFKTRVDNYHFGWPVPEGIKSILWLSRLQGWKRPDRAIEALHGLMALRQDTYLVFVGDGDWVPTLREQVKQFGVEEKVHFLGAVPHSHVAYFYQQCDIFLSLFDYSNLSNTVIESMSNGCCVVALNEGDTHLLVRDGETGFLVDKGQIETLPDLLNTLLDDEHLRGQVGKQAQKFVQTQLPSWDERIQWEIDLLESLVEDK